MGRTVIVITDGENHEGGAVEAANAAAEKGIQVNVLGVGMQDHPAFHWGRANGWALLTMCEVQGRTLVFHMQNNELLESVGSMDDLSGQLAKYNNFLRAHRSYLVNMEYIKTISSKAILMVNH